MMIETHTSPSDINFKRSTKMLHCLDPLKQYEILKSSMGAQCGYISALDLKFYVHLLRITQITKIFACG